VRRAVAAGAHPVPRWAMDNGRRTRTIVLTVFVVALVLALLVGDGSSVAVVAVVGGVVLGATYTLTRSAARARSGRSARRAARRR